MRIALLHSRVRVEERLLIEELESRGVELDLIDVRDLVLDAGVPATGSLGRFEGVDVVFDRCLALSHSQTIGRVCETMGLRVVNRPAVVDICADKLRTSLALTAAGIPQCRYRVAVSDEAAVQACEQLGYPVVLKPTVGSWGRLVSKANDRDAAEAIIEHRSTLGGPQHGVFYVQEYIDKSAAAASGAGGRDIRAFVVAGETIAAIGRTSEHWITNTARGASAGNCPVTPELDELCRRAAAAVSGEIVAVDVFETGDGSRGPGGLIVNELNHTMEFRNSIEPTGVNIPARMIDLVLAVGEGADRPVAEGVSAAAPSPAPARAAAADREAGA